MKILCVLGEHNYGKPERGEAYEFVNFLPALRNLGHQVIHFESFSKDKYKNFAELNEKLLDIVQTEKPEMILCVLLGYEVWLDTLDLIRAGSSATLINWSTDDSWKYQQFSKYIAGAFDVYATTYPAALLSAHADGHKNFALTQWAASSSSLMEPLPAAMCRYPVTFIGTAYGNRPRWIESLRAQGIDVECFGYGWPNGPVSSDKIPGIMRESVISLNFSDAGNSAGNPFKRSENQIKARVFEVPGMGGCLLTQYAPDLEKFYLPDKEVVTFFEVSDLAQKIKFYLSDFQARDRVATAGHQRTRLEHTYEMRFRALVGKADLRHPVGKSMGQIDFTQFQRLKESHEVGPLLSAFKRIWQFFFVMVWGEVRGPRAARRVLFEISWRLFGQVTYRARGWPGRLFYKES